MALDTSPFTPHPKDAIAVDTIDACMFTGDPAEWPAKEAYWQRMLTRWQKRLDEAKRMYRELHLKFALDDKEVEDANHFLKELGSGLRLNRSGGFNVYDVKKETPVYTGETLDDILKYVRKEMKLD
jgi:hypothetical protein